MTDTLSNDPLPADGVGNGWQPIETAPREGVLDLWCAYGRAVDCRWEVPSYPSGEYGHDEKSLTDMTKACWVTNVDDSYGVAVPAPTHWMPLPPPPSNTGQDT